MAQAEVRTYLVDTGKILDKEAEKDSGEQSASHLQGSSQQVVPGGALKNQPRKCTTQSAQKSTDRSHVVPSQRDPARWKTADVFKNGKKKMTRIDGVPVAKATPKHVVKPVMARMSSKLPAAISSVGMPCSTP